MSNLFKSILVILPLAFIIVAIVRTMLKLPGAFKSNVFQGIMLCVLIVVMITVSIPLSRYIIPFNLIIKPQYETTIQTTEEITDRPWFCMYTINHPLFNFSTDGIDNEMIVLSNYNADFKPDLNKYSYIVSFGREINTLSYNAWYSHGTPLLDLGLSSKWGRASYVNDEFDEHKIYIYKFPKRAVNNFNAACGSFVLSEEDTSRKVKQEEVVSLDKLYSYLGVDLSNYEVRDVNTVYTEYPCSQVYRNVIGTNVNIKVKATAKQLSQISTYTAERLEDPDLYEHLEDNGIIADDIISKLSAIKKYYYEDDFSSAYIPYEIFYLVIDDTNDDSYNLIISARLPIYLTLK